MTAQAYLKTLRFLQLTLFMGYLIGIIISIGLYFLEIVPLLPESRDNFLIDIGVVALTFSGVFSAFYLFQSLLLKQNERHSLARKLGAFKATYFIRLAIIEALGMIALVLFIISMSPIALTSSLIIAIILWYLKPSKREMVRVLRLNPTEEARLSSKETIVADIDQELFQYRKN